MNSTPDTHAPPDVFSSASVGGMALKNRVVMAPMTRSRANAQGEATALMATYYAQRAEAGLIVSEAVDISPQGKGFSGTPGIHTDAQRDAWREVSDAVHAAGSRLFMQLWHVGRIAHPANMAPGLHPVAPSAVVFPRKVVTPAGEQPVPVPRALSTEEVAATVRDYAQAARRAVDAGCDGIEIHGANGYLPSQFLHESSNLRTDRYGGSLANRARFILETAEACAAAVGPQRVGIRLTPFNKFNGAESADEAGTYDYLLPRLQALGLAYLHVVRAQVSGNQSVSGPVADVLGFVRPRWSGTLVAAGDFTLDTAREELRQGRCDLVAFGRDFIGNPDLVTRLRQGLPLVPRQPSQWYGSGAEGYTDYARAQAPSLSV
ncbi:alkene reductase [Hydrogenophaga sp.]|uniref:alkene reductase n=1 Tax=Hydrogenophaga sp. TaxID=1904254 RepID=UPI00260922AB|nr:alkene reductase [Hydrogenophaga sp.]MCW5653328.1 alkene reductase [Hydrogenophaga sp.]